MTKKKDRARLRLREVMTGTRVVGSDDREEVIEIRPVKSMVSNPSRERRTRKRRMQTGFEGSWSAGIGMDEKTIDSDDSTYQDSRTA